MSVLPMNIRLVNMDRRPDRLERFTKLAEEIGLKFDRFSAIDGQLIDQTDKQLMSLFENNRFNWRAGVIGCILSHLYLWEELVQSNEEFMVVLEDDIDFCPNFMTELNKVLSLLNKDSRPLTFLGYTAPKKTIPPGGDPNNVGVYPFHDRRNVWGGTFGYIIHRDCAAKFASDIRSNGITRPIDVYMFKHPGVYCTYPSLVQAEYVTPGSNVDSDIQFDMLSIKDDWIFYRGKDSPGNEIEQTRGTYRRIMRRADQVPECVAFNSYGSLKSDVVSENEFTDMVNPPSGNYGLFVRKSYLRKKIA